jgi:hypothetical protein
MGSNLARDIHAGVEPANRGTISGVFRKVDPTSESLEAVEFFLLEQLAAEEGHHGLFEQIIRMTPRLCARVAQLRDEHARLREAIENLHQLRDLDAPSGLIHATVEALLDGLQHHSAAEQALLQEAWLTDLGAAG